MISCFCFWPRVVAVVPSAETFAASGVIFLDCHVRITEPDDLDFVSVLDVHLKLFTFSGRTHHFVEWRVLFLFLSHLRNPRCDHAS